MNRDDTHDYVLNFIADPAPLRLVSVQETSPSNNAGRLEVFLNGRWGTVCSLGFDSVEADIVCRQLGFEGYVVFGRVGSFG